MLFLIYYLNLTPVVPLESLFLYHTHMQLKNASAAWLHIFLNGQLPTTACSNTLLIDS